MTTSERLESLLQDLQGVMISKPPRDNAPPGTEIPNFYAKADQLVVTGTPGNFVTLNYQAVGDSIVDVLEGLSKQVAASKAFGAKPKSPILTRNGGRE